MLVMHYVTHRENSVVKNVAPELYALLYSVIKCINSIEANAKAECLFQRFCEANRADH